MKKILIILAMMTNLCFGSDWTLGPFIRMNKCNPIITPNLESIFYCPLSKKEVFWECDHTFNPAAVVHDGKIFLFYRAEDDSGDIVGEHTSRIGIASSHDGLHFTRYQTPVLFPDHDDQQTSEWPGGCEDPRVVKREDGTFVMTYTQWNQKIPVIGVATSEDLFHWKKHGYAFKNTEKFWCKSGSIICRLEGDELIATRINGKYWMYFGDTNIFLATSDDLISWELLKDSDDKLLVTLRPREGYFDSELVEPGPPAILTKNGILLLYNGRNAESIGDPNIDTYAYAAGQVLFDANDPAHVLDRTESCFLKPEKPYERWGQYEGGTVFIQGLVHFKKRWYLYYGGCDSIVGVVVRPSTKFGVKKKIAELANMQNLLLQ